MVKLESIKGDFMDISIILVIVIIVLVAALFAISFVKRKKFNGELSQMREELKVGDKVMTDTGVVGEVVDSYVEDDYKYFVLKSGKGDKVGYFTVHANAIYYVYGKEEPVKEKVVVKVVPKAEALATEKVEAKEEKAEEPKDKE